VCESPLAVECDCSICHHQAPSDRFHSCLDHRDMVAERHKEREKQLAQWKVYEMPRVTEASPPPPPAMTPPCDGSADGEKPCQTPPNWECLCPRCARERDPSERYHACEAHKGAAADRHRQVRERPAEWSAYWPPERPAKPTLPTVPSRDFTLPEGPQGGATGPRLEWPTGLPVEGQSAREIVTECDALARLLLSKNAKYGDSALNPRRIFAKADAVEQIKVRIDDKISRIENGDASIEDEDVVQDLLGYLILLRIATKRKAAASAKKDP